MRRFSTSLVPFSLLFIVLGLSAALAGYQHGQPGAAIVCAILFAPLAWLCWGFRRESVFDDRKRMATLTSGIWPRIVTRRVSYDDVSRFELCAMHEEGGFLCWAQVCTQRHVKPYVIDKVFDPKHADLEKIYVELAKACGAPLLLTEEYKEFLAHRARRERRAKPRS